MYIHFDPLKPDLDYIIPRLKSLRIQPGDRLICTDLKGSVSELEVVVLDYKSNKFEWKILSQKDIKNVSSNILIQCIPDKHYLEKLAELLPHSGVSKIILLKSDYSPNYSPNLDRFNRILVRAAEQAESVSIPKVEISNNFELLISEYKPLVLEVSGKKLEYMTMNNESRSIMVGPEGGYSENEHSIIESYSLEKVNISPFVLPSWVAGFAFFNKIY